MKKINDRFASVLTRTLAAALILNLLTGCSMSGSQGASASRDASGAAKTDSASDAEDSASDASASGSAASGAAEDSAKDGVSISFSNDGITAADSSGLSIDGTSLTITASGTYLLSGSCEDGSVKVQKGTTGVVLVLDGLTLSSQTTAPIICAKSTEVTIEAAAGTVNTLSDTEANNDGSDNSNTEANNDGSDDSNTKANNDGSDDSNTENNNADGSDSETVTTNDASTNSAAENAVIKCKDGSQVVLCGTGELILRANGKNGIKSGASTETEGDASLTIRELTLTIDVPVNDAVNAESILNVESGTLEISAGDDALHSDGELNIGVDGTDGPSISITSCYEGLEGTVVNIFSGDIDLQSTDDCINAADSDQPNGDFQINITGGKITASASDGDGFDSNGDLTISGGSVAVWTANAADNEPLDADGTVTISGGTVLAAGESSGMGIHLEASQPCVIFSGDSSEGGGFRQTALLTKGSSFSILSDDQATLYSAEAMCSASYIIFSSPDLTESASCSLSSGDTETTSSAQSGSISTGMGGKGGFKGFGDFKGSDGQRPEGERPEGNPPSGEGNGQQSGGNPPSGKSNEQPEGNPTAGDGNEQPEGNPTTGDGNEQPGDPQTDQTTAK